MKEIDHALQYTVYDMGNGRVFKKINTRARQETVLRSWGYKFKIHITYAISKINRRTRTSNAAIRQRLEEKTLPSRLLANPIFENETDYTQDKVIQMGHYFATHSLEQNMIMIDRYIGLTHELWSYGIADLIFNLTLNNGVASDGSVVQLDFGECSFDYPTVLKYIKRKKWLRPFSYNYFVDNPVRPYASERFEKEFAVDKFNNIWNSKNINK